MVLFDIDDTIVPVMSPIKAATVALVQFMEVSMPRSVESVKAGRLGDIMKRFVRELNNTMGNNVANLHSVSLLFRRSVYALLFIRSSILVSSILIVEFINLQAIQRESSHCPRPHRASYPSPYRGGN